MTKAHNAPAVLAAALALTAFLGGRATAAIIYYGSIDETLVGDLDQHDVELEGDPYPGWGTYACAPTATTNALVYLQNKYPQRYQTRLVPNPEDLVPVARELADYMNTPQTPTGTSATSLVNGLSEYLDFHAPSSTWVEKESDPLWKSLCQRLRQRAGVVLLLYPVTGGMGHYVTLTELYFRDENENSVIEYTEEAYITVVDPDTGDVMGGPTNWRTEIWEERLYGPLHISYHDPADWQIISAVSARPSRCLFTAPVFPFVSTFLVSPLQIIGSAEEAITDIYAFPNFMADTAYAPTTTALGWNWEYISRDPSGVEHPFGGFHWSGPALGPGMEYEFSFNTLGMTSVLYQTWLFDSTSGVWYTEANYEEVGVIPEPATAATVCLYLIALVARRVRDEARFQGARGAKTPLRT